MNLQPSPEDEAFRQQVRAFLREHLPADVARRSLIGMHPPHDADRRWWNSVLQQQGWAAPHWPQEDGGTGWSHLQQHIFETECRLAGAPELRWQGLKLLGPVLCAFGTPEQKARYLPPILAGEVGWAQGFSEPGAGSDLAALKTSAVLDGDHYVINGQKLWTTEAQYSEWGFFLVRTAQTEKPHRGISMIVLDMKSPGVTVRTISMINGDESTAEVFLDNVRVPKENLIGVEGEGWTQARVLLGNERTSSADLPKARADLARIRRIAAGEQLNGQPLLQDSTFARKLATLEIEVDALEWSVLRVMHEAPSEHPIAASASVLKIRGSELQQRLTELGVEALGERALRYYDRESGFAPDAGDALWPDYAPGTTVDLLYLRACTIFGGAKEVQKNIIAKLAFGLS